jgi:hypothetical protein
MSSIYILNRMRWEKLKRVKGQVAGFKSQDASLKSVIRRLKPLQFDPSIDSGC